MFILTWGQHGGSGLSITWEDALSLEPSDRDWLVHRIAEQRRREAEAIRKARS